jgi:phosphoglycerol geranylgeranyltransferase
LFLSSLNHFSSAGKKMLGVLIDPDKVSERSCDEIASLGKQNGVDLFLVGGSLLSGDGFEKCILSLKTSGIPVIIFPGNTMQISNKADGLFFLSLISGRNADMLIGRHVIAAPLLKRSSLEIIPTGYILIDSGAPTSVSYMSGTTPIPHDKDDIAACTALAGEMLGLRMIYMDAGSGARHTISTSMVSNVKKNVTIPLVVGGGIRTPEKAFEICEAGADMIVIGNALEKDRSMLSEFSSAVHSFQTI